MTGHHVRVIDHHAFPCLLRTLCRAQRTGEGERVASLLERSLTLAVTIEELRDAEILLLQHSARGAGIASVPVHPRGSEDSATPTSVVLLGSFQEYLQLTDILKAEHGPLSDVASEVKGAIFRFREHSFTVPLPGDEELILGPRTLVMGILNVTPDSFSDGGDIADPEAAVARGKEMVAEGADILDVGGESTRPGAEPVPQDMELARILPVIERLAAEVDVPIAVDTRRGAIAREAAKAGARIINDVSGLSDPLTGAVAAHSGVPVIIMHSRGTPADMREKAVYTDVMREIIDELTPRIQRALDAGVEDSGILLDPGIGFAKTGPQSLEVLARLMELRSLGFPIVVGPSRKSFLTEIEDVEPGDRGSLTLGAIAACVTRGAHIVRVHDVRPAVQQIRTLEAIAKA